MESKNALSGLWFLSGGLAVTFVSLLAFRWLFPLPIEQTVPQITHRPGLVAVDLDLTSHLARQCEGTLRVSLGHSHHGRYGSGAVLLDRRDVRYFLLPGQTRHVRCEFHKDYRDDPNFAEAVLLP